MKALNNYIHLRIKKQHPNESYANVVDAHRVWFETILEIRKEFEDLGLLETVGELDQILRNDYHMLRSLEKQELLSVCNEAVITYFKGKETCQ